MTTKVKATGKVDKGILSDMAHYQKCERLPTEWEKFGGILKFLCNCI